jgi:hypothetical protein
MAEKIQEPTQGSLESRQLYEQSILLYNIVMKLEEISNLLQSQYGEQASQDPASL